MLYLKMILITTYCWVSCNPFEYSTLKLYLSKFTMLKPTVDPNRAIMQCRFAIHISWEDIWRQPCRKAARHKTFIHH